MTDMTPETNTTVTPDGTPDTDAPVRTFYRKDYERTAEILRSMRYGKSAAQLPAVDALTQVIVSSFVADNPSFDPAPFTRASLRRIETVDNADYVAYAIENDVDPNEATLNESAFYAHKASQADEWDDEDAEEE